MADGAGTAGGGELRHRFAVGVVAAPGVSLEALLALVAGGATPGFSVIKREDVLAADDAEAQEKKADLIAEDPEAPVPAELFGALLRAALGKEVGEKPAAPEDDKLTSVLLRIDRGPREFTLAFDFPASIVEADGFMAGGGLDAVVLVRKAEGAPDAMPASAAEGGEEGEEGEAVPKVDGEQLYGDLMSLAQTQRAGHNATADTAFEELSDNADAEALLEEVARALVKVVGARLEYLDWLAGVEVVAMDAQPVDLRHYDALLAPVPPQCHSVATVLHALLEQVALTSADESGESRDQRQLWRDNRSLLSPMDAALSSLSIPGVEGAPPVQPPAGFPAGDARLMRLYDPALQEEAGRRLVADAEARFQTFLDVQRAFPSGGALETGEDAGEEATLFAALAAGGLSATQTARGLRLTALEALVGVECGADGRIHAREGREMDDMSLHDLCFSEQLGPDALPQVRSYLTQSMN